MKHPILVAGMLLLSFKGVAAGGPEQYLKDYKRPSNIPHPKDNGHSVDKQELGRALFFDPRLSGSEWISCATCHNPALGWEDGLKKGIGHGMKQLGRATPTILNLAWGELMFWDGRAEGLEDQALGPVESAAEMNMPLDKMIEKLNSIRGYKPMFDRAYPKEGITKTTIAKAIASFERHVVSGTAPFDRWVSGDSKAVSASAKRGFELFNAKANCAVCHSGWRFTDDGFHDIGIPGTDKGRGELLKDVEVLQFAFKTPTLRNIVERAPYMHDGSETTLEQVVDFYNVGGKAKRSSLSENVKPLGLSNDEKIDLVNFLKALSSKDKEIAAPQLPM